MSRFGEPSLWMVLNKTLDAYHAGQATYEQYLAAFEEWHAERQESARRELARMYGDKYAEPRGGNQ